MIFLSVIAFIVIFSALILIHEWGHFTAARKFGVKVEEFGLGLPPLAKKLFRDKKKTEYTLNWLPLGGFVRMKGEDTYDRSSLTAKDSFAAKPVWQRSIIVTAGVAMNAVLGVILLAIVLMAGNKYLIGLDETGKFLEENPKAEILNQEFHGMLVEGVIPDSPAAVAEIQKFDFVSAVDGETFSSSEEFIELIKQHASQETTLDVIRRELHFQTTITPNSDGKIGMGISGPMEQITVRYSPLAAIPQAGYEAWRLTKMIVGGVANLFGSLLTGEMPAEIGGPVAIAKETFYRASSVTALLSFTAMLSITLAIFNILPIPALDGGRLLFLLFEGITRRRVTPKIEAYIHAAGYILLIGLILVITFKDIFL